MFGVDALVLGVYYLRRFKDFGPTAFRIHEAYGFRVGLITYRSRGVKMHRALRICSVFQMSYSLNSSKGTYIGNYIGDYCRGYKGATRSLDAQIGYSTV